MGLTPGEFWEMTPAEFQRAWEGYNRRLKDGMRQAAWQVAHQLNLWSKDAVSPQELLGEAEAQPIFSSREDIVAYMRERKQRGSKRGAKRRRG